MHLAAWSDEIFSICNSPGSRANNIYSPGSDQLTEVQLYLSTSCQPGSRVIRALSDVEKFVFFIFLFGGFNRRLFSKKTSKYFATALSSSASSPSTFFLYLCHYRRYLLETQTSCLPSEGEPKPLGQAVAAERWHQPACGALVLYMKFIQRSNSSCFNSLTTRDEYC